MGTCLDIVREKLKWKKDDAIVIQKLIDEAGNFLVLWDELRAAAGT